jgi:membrane protein YqaA with SNARE-associated domain
VSWLRHFAQFFFRIGGTGLLAVSFLDSSFLVLPLGNDLLLIVLSTQHRSRMPYYALMAAVGSVLGCWLMAGLGRRGERGLRKRMSKRRLQFVEKQVKKHGMWALSFASLMPPPFPFTTVVTGAAALDYPRKKLLTVISVMRFVRFVLEGVVALIYGRWIFSVAQSDKVKFLIAGVAGLMVLGSVYSIYGWTREGGKTTRRTA